MEHDMGSECGIGGGLRMHHRSMHDRTLLLSLILFLWPIFDHTVVVTLNFQLSSNMLSFQVDIISKHFQNLSIRE